MLVRVSLDGSGFVEFEGVETVSVDEPLPTWHHLTFSSDWDDDILINWLYRNVRRGVEYMRWTHGVNAISLAPAYRVEILRVN